MHADDVFYWTIFWFDLTWFASVILIFLLALWEVAQLLSKIINGRIKTYISITNFVDWFIIISASLFLLVFGHDNAETGGHLLGWALFLSYMDLTLLLGHIRLFGQTIHMSISVMKSIGLKMLSLVPSCIAFAAGFHAFLYGSPAFRTPYSSLLKTLAMLIGEYETEEEFLSDKVESVGGRDASTQVGFDYPYCAICCNEIGLKFLF